MISLTRLVVPGDVFARIKVKEPREEVGAKFVSDAQWRFPEILGPASDIALSSMRRLSFAVLFFVS